MELEFFEEHEAMISARRGSSGQDRPARAGRLGVRVGGDGSKLRLIVCVSVMLLAALAVTATLLLIVRHGPPDNPDMSGSAAANSSSTGGGDADGIVPCDLFGP